MMLLSSSPQFHPPPRATENSSAASSLQVNFRSVSSILHPVRIFYSADIPVTFVDTCLHLSRSLLCRTACRKHESVI